MSSWRDRLLGKQAAAGDGGGNTIHVTMVDAATDRVLEQLTPAHLHAALRRQWRRGFWMVVLGSYIIKRIVEFDA